MQTDPDAPATYADLQKFATKEDLEKFATKEDLEKFATKEDLLEMEQRVTLSLAGEIARGAEVTEQRITRSLAGEIARATDAFADHCASLIRVADDQTNAVEDQLAEHVADGAVHKRPARRR